MKTFKLIIFILLLTLLGVHASERENYSLFQNIQKEKEKWFEDQSLLQSKLDEKKKNFLSLWCKEAKLTRKRMIQEGLHVDIGLRSDIHEKKSYIKDQLGDSAFWVSTMNKVYLQCFGTQKACTGVKHFPGLGNISLDPHKKAKESLKINQLIGHEFYPFYTSTQNGSCTLMSTHAYIKYKNGERELCSLGKKCIQIIRKGLNYDGIILADELQNMLAVLEEVVDREYGPLQLSLNQKSWDDFSLDKKINFLSNFKVNAKCSSLGCKKNYKKKYKNFYKDRSGFKRALAAIGAGNDMILQFFPPKSIEKRLNNLIKSLDHALQQGKLSKNEINHSVRRILQLKKRFFGKKLFKRYRVKSIDALLKKLNWKEKLAQMITVEGNFDKNVKAATRMNLGGLYFPKKGPKKLGVHPYLPKVPFIFFGDKEYSKTNFFWKRKFDKLSRKSN